MSVNLNSGNSSFHTGATSAQPFVAASSNQQIIIFLNSGVLIMGGIFGWLIGGIQSELSFFSARSSFFSLWTVNFLPVHCVSPKSPCGT